MSLDHAALTSVGLVPDSQGLGLAIERDGARLMLIGNKNSDLDDLCRTEGGTVVHCRPDQAAVWLSAEAQQRSGLLRQPELGPEPMPVPFTAHTMVSWVMQQPQNLLPGDAGALEHCTLVVQVCCYTSVWPQSAQNCARKSRGTSHFHGSAALPATASVMPTPIHLYVSDLGCEFYCRQHNSCKLMPRIGHAW